MHSPLNLITKTLLLSLACTSFISVANDDAPASQSIERVEVVYKRSSVTSEITEDAQKLMDMPGAMGDPLQAAYALPGVVAAGGAMGSPAVRGSSPSDNSFEVDFMPAGYIFHDFGSSIFNKNLVQDFQLYSAGYGSSYANVTGAVFDVSLRNPKYQAIATHVDLSMFNAGVFVEGQATDNSAFYFSVRKSTLPIFFKEGEELEDDDGEKTGIVVNDAPDDHDYQGKWVFDLNDNNMLSFNVTGAEDSAAAGFNERADIAKKTPEFQGDARFIRKFNSQSIVWEHFNKQLYVKTGIGHLNSDERLEYGKIATKTKGYFHDVNISKTTLKTRVNYRFDNTHRLIADLAYEDNQTSFDYDTFLYVCTEQDPDCDLNKREQITGRQEASHDLLTASLTHVWTPNENWQTELGVQAVRYQLSKETFVTPRLAIDYFLSATQTLSLKAGSYNRQQDIGYILPEIGNPDLKSQQANHLTLGYKQQLQDEWSWSLETYYKTMKDLPYAQSAAADNAPLYSNDVEGKAYGVELLINKNKTDNWYGWLAISAAKSERTELPTNTTRDYFADTPLVINAVVQYEINEIWNVGFNFTARSGQAYTPIIAVRENPDFADHYLPVYGEPYSKRHDFYHRLDVRAERKTDWFGLDGKLVFEIMNVYDQENISEIDLDYKKVTSTSGVVIKEESDDFEMRPSIGYSFKF